MKTWIRHRLTILILFLVILTVVVGGVWRYGYGQALDQLKRRGEADLALASDRLTAQLQRYQELAVLLASHPDLTGLTGPSPDVGKAHDLMLDAADKTAALDLIYASVDGTVLASAQGSSADYAKIGGEPYFERALHGALGSFHGVNTRYGRRAFYFASPTFGENGQVSGVLVVVADVENVEWNWRGDRPAVFFVDDTDVVFISNRSELLLWERFGAEGGLRPPVGIASPFRSYMRAGHVLWRLDWGPYIPKRGLHLVKPLPVFNLTGEAIVDVGPALQIAGLQATLVAVLGLGFAAFLFQTLQRRRVLHEANTKLEARVFERTSALSDINRQLRREIGEREEAEAALKKAQDDLVQAGKLSALGQMSAGISHELNQPLMAIQQFAENGSLYLARGKADVAKDNLSRISELSKRMARIIRNLRAFARNESEPMGRVDICSVIAASLELAETRLLRDGVQVHFDRPNHPVLVRGGDVRLGQVLLNLISNAADAMVESDPKILKISLQEGPRVFVTVSDTGPGIAEPAKIFDPFFSTKQVGASEGMGLGLSISYGLVQSFGGNIRGENTDQGAVFSVELERWQEVQAA